MDFLNWILKTTVLLALLFLGMESKPEKDEASNQNVNAAGIHLLLR